MHSQRTFPRDLRYFGRDYLRPDYYKQPVEIILPDFRDRRTLIYILTLEEIEIMPLAKLVEVGAP